MQTAFFRLPVKRIRPLRAARARLTYAAAALVSVLIGACTPHDDGSGSIVWQDCRHERFAAWALSAVPDHVRCATLSVPLNPARPQEGAVTLALTRLKAADPQQRLGSLLVIPGGPGQHSLDWWAFMDAEHLSELHPQFDLIGIAPRGIAPSSPALDCGSAGWHGGTTAQERVAACVAHSGADFLAHLGTAEAAADVEALRRALGEEQWNFIAYSYGTKVAAVYLRRHSGQVRAAVLDGVVETTEDWFAMIGGQERGLQRTFGRFAADCARHADCPFRPDASAEAQFHDFLRRLERQNLSDRLGRRIGGDQVLAVVAENLMWPESWPEIRRLMQDLAAGKTDAFHALTYDNLNSFAVPATPDSRHWSLFAVNCADSALPPHMRERRGYLNSMQALDALSTYDNYRPRREADLLDECYYWPHAGTDDLSPPPPLDGRQVLLVAQTDDPATPYANARRMAGYWQAPLLTREGDGHTLALAGVSRCIDERVLAYLRQPQQAGTAYVCRD